MSLMGPPGPRPPTETPSAFLANLEANTGTMPAPGTFATYSQPPGPANQDPPGPILTGTPAGAADLDDEFGEPMPARSRSNALRVPTPIRTLKSRPWEAIARGLFKAGAGLLNMRLQTGPEDDSFIPDAEDLRDVPAPLGRIAARHVPLPDKADLTELEDIGAAIVSMIAWAGKGIVSAAEKRSALRRGVKTARATGAAVHDDSGESGDQ